MAKTPSSSENEPVRPHPSGNKLLDSFLQSVENFVGRVSTLSADAAPQGEARLMIQSTGDSLIGQTAKLSGFIRETASRLSGPQRAELDRFLQVQDGEAFARRAADVTEKVLAGGVVGRLLNWISQHLKELKKILLEIIHFIFDLLSIPFPEWLDKILLIMDEFLDLLLSLLSDVFGIDFGRTARELSEQEVNYLRELAALESLRAARGNRRQAQDEG